MLAFVSYAFCIRNVASILQPYFIDSKQEQELRQQQLHIVTVCPVFRCGSGHHPHLLPLPAPATRLLGGSWRRLQLNADFGTEIIENTCLGFVDSNGSSNNNKEHTLSGQKPSWLHCRPLRPTPLIPFPDVQLTNFVGFGRA